MADLALKQIRVPDSEDTVVRKHIQYNQSLPSN